MWAISNPSSPLPPFAQPAQATPLPRGPPTRAWSQAMSAHVAAGGGDLRPSLRARASGKQIAPPRGLETVEQTMSRPEPNVAAARVAAIHVPPLWTPSNPPSEKVAYQKRESGPFGAAAKYRVGEEQRGFGTFRNRLSPRGGKGVRGVPRGPLTCLYAPRAHSL